MCPRRGNIRLLLNKGRETGVSFSSFIPYHCVTNLTSAKEEGRQLGVKQFGEGVEIPKTSKSSARRLEPPRLHALFSSLQRGSWRGMCLFPEHQNLRVTLEKS
jgi:hypothetical protein